MKKYNNKKKNEALGANASTLQARLSRQLLFKYVGLSNDVFCYRCASKIESIEEFSIEHKVSWLNSDSPKDLFMDLDNIAFSHLECNLEASNQDKKDNRKHPSNSAYKRGCRCEGCTKCSTEAKAKYRLKRKNTLLHSK